MREGSMPSSSNPVRRKLAEFERAIILTDPENGFVHGKARAKACGESRRRRLMTGMRENLVAGTALQPASQTGIRRAHDRAERAHACRANPIPALAREVRRRARSSAVRRMAHAARPAAAPLSTRFMQVSDKGQAPQ